MKQKIRIGTRGSRLAIWQAEYLAEQLRQADSALEIEIVTITTSGDKILDVPLAKIGGKGLFTKEIEREILDGTIDIAVHSLKDMPTDLPDGLVIGAVTKRTDPRDALVSLSGKSFDELPVGARVGTSSLRRRAQLLALRPDLQIIDLRGNVDTRLAKLQNGELDAVVLAAAGLQRLGLQENITELFALERFLPAVGQGILAVEARAGDDKILNILRTVNDEATAASAEAERSFLRRIEGGCQIPVGVYAETSDGKTGITALIASLDGRQIVRGTLKGKAAGSGKIGISLADALLADGGDRILQEIKV